MVGLQPLSPSRELEDPGAHDLEPSDDEHFSDASDGANSYASIPTTRVEKTDDGPSHGEVPGTPAYNARIQDATPDEVEVIRQSGQQPGNASSAPIPKTVVDKVDPDQPGHGDVKGTLAYDLRKADAAPDVVRAAPEVTRADLDDEDHRSSDDEISATPPIDTESKHDGAAGEDDFDDFAEGDDEGEDDFGAFDEGHEDDEDGATRAATMSSVPAPQLSLSVPSFEVASTLDDVTSAAQPYTNELFPQSTSHSETDSATLPDINHSFLNERSQSLWQQLVAPPPLQPPDWVRSRIRRLFLVSLGVPVDLDEILPASKQKKLILPSIDLESGEERQSREESLRVGTAADRLRSEPSRAVSRSPSSAKTDRRRKGPPPPPDFDANRARLICSTSETAIKNFADPELRAHLGELERLKHRASQLLEYWLVQKDSASRNKEAFEEVIENLVKHAKKIRK